MTGSPAKNCVKNSDDVHTIRMQANNPSSKQTSLSGDFSRVQNKQYLEAANALNLTSINFKEIFE
jgi:hypothetical protein